MLIFSQGGGDRWRRRVGGQGACSLLVEVEGFPPGLSSLLSARWVSTNSVAKEAREAKAVWSFRPDRLPAFPNSGGHCGGSVSFPRPSCILARGPGRGRTPGIPVGSGVPGGAADGGGVNIGEISFFSSKPGLAFSRRVSGVKQS